MRARPLAAIVAALLLLPATAATAGPGGVVDAPSSAVTGDLPVDDGAPADPGTDADAPADAGAPADTGTSDDAGAGADDGHADHDHESAASGPRGSGAVRAELAGTQRRYPDGPGVLEGRLITMHGDRDGAPSDESVILEVGDLPVVVDLPYAEGNRIAGSRVRITGRVERGVLVPDAGTSPQVLGAVAPASATPRTVAVILIDFETRTGQPWTTTQVENLILDGDGDNPNSVRAYYEELSDGTITLGGAVLGWYRISADTTTCAYRDWASKARAAAQADATTSGIDLASTDVIKVYAFPSIGACGWAGLGELPGDDNWINNSMNLRVVAHEIGHNVGAHHASTMTCTDASGARMPTPARAIGDDCSVSEYGDPFSVMGGSSTRTFHAWHRTQTIGVPVGTLAAQTVTLTNGYDQVHEIGRLEPGSGAVRLLRIARAATNTFLDLELRGAAPPFDVFTLSGSGTGQEPLTGVTARLGYAANVRSQSQLVDATLSTASFGDAPLQPGQTLHDAVSGATVTMLEVVDDVARVRVQYDPDTQAPTAPPTLTATATAVGQVTLAWTAASDDRRLAGYEVRRNGTRIAIAKGLSYLDACGSACGAGQTVTYDVLAYDSSGRLSTATRRTVTMPQTDTTPPSKVAGLAVTDVTSTSVALSWSAATDVGSGVAGYEVLRADVVVATTTALSANVTGLSADTSYSLTVRAYDVQANRGAASDPLVQSTEPAPTAPASVATSASAATATVTFTSRDGFAVHEVRRELLDTRRNTWGSVTTVRTGLACSADTACTVTDTVTKAGTYRYSVRTVNGTLLTAWVVGPQVALQAASSGGSTGGGGKGGGKK